LKDFPDVKTIGVLFSTGEANSEVQIEDARAVLESRGMTLKEVGITSSADVPTAMSTLVNDIDAYFAITDNLASSSASVIGQILLENKIPSFAAEQGPAENGLLLSDGIDYKEQGVEAAKEAIEILKGKSPSEIPVFFSKTSNRYVNEETEKALGIKVDR
jgi:putative ABC transport system substrate-binding protein